jgi:glyoxylate reductase
VRVLAPQPFPGPAWSELDEVEYADWPLHEVRPGVEVLAVVATPVDQAVLDLLPDLRVVANYGVGYDLIDVDACTRRGVAVTNTPVALGITTADLTMALILAVRRRVVELDRWVREGKWGASWHAADQLADDVTGATLGIVGLGRIGHAVAQRALGFEMRVLYTRRSNAEAPGLERRDLEDLLRESEIVTLHMPLTDETRGLIGASRLALMQDGACLINTSRGALVDEQALVRELVSGRLRAGLDVFVDEPHVPPELLELPNVVLQPHVGSATRATREAATEELVANIRAALDGRPLPNPVA